MKKYSKYLKFGAIIASAFLLIFLIILFSISHITKSYESQTAAKRWQSEELRYSQLTAFISEDAGFNYNSAKQVHNNIVKKLADDSYASQNGEKVALTNSLSQTKLTFKSVLDSCEAQVYFTGNDHFIFHPYEFISGWYYTGDESSNNFVVLNEELAFRLYGGTDVAGLEIEVSGTKCEVLGVTSGPFSDSEKRLWEKDIPRAYMMSGFGENINNDLPIICFEALLPNPVKDYAMNIFKEAVMFDENSVEIIENSQRIRYVELLKSVFKEDTDMMRNNTIYYPYWENAARRMLSTVKVPVFLSVVAAAVPALYIFSLIVILFINKEKLIKKSAVFLTNNFIKTKKAIKKRRAGNDEN
ncbi:MAG: ABC transporter permease [Ruminococcaceae bacterium]|nr:ABC transporter permease [Oscillospiraceae bacterium]